MEWNHTQIDKYTHTHTHIMHTELNDTQSRKTQSISPDYISDLDDIQNSHVSGWKCIYALCVGTIV